MTQYPRALYFLQIPHRADLRIPGPPTVTPLSWDGCSFLTFTSAWWPGRSSSLLVMCCRDCSFTESSVWEVWAHRYMTSLVSSSIFSVQQVTLHIVNQARATFKLANVCSDCMPCLLPVAPEPTAHWSVQSRECRVHYGSIGACNATVSEWYVLSCQINV